jgi:hypothetical protein
LKLDIYRQTVVPNLQNTCFFNNEKSAQTYAITFKYILLLAYLHIVCRTAKHIHKYASQVFSRPFAASIPRIAGTIYQQPNNDEYLREDAMLPFLCFASSQILDLRQIFCPHFLSLLLFV